MIRVGTLIKLCVGCVLPIAIGFLNSSAWADEDGSMLKQNIQGMDGTRILESMQKAATQSNYDLYMTKSTSGQLEPVIYSHGVSEDGHAFSRWLYLDNAATGYYTKDNKIVYFNNGEEKMAVGNGRLPSVFPRLLTVPSASIKTSYQPVVMGEIRAAGHRAIGVRLMPRWNDRYSYVLAVDSETLLPLNVQVINPKQGVVETYSGVKLEVRDNFSLDISGLIPSEKSLEPGVDLDSSTAELGWQVSYVPEGFKRIYCGQYALGSYGSQVDHMLYSDGLADFSIYRLRSLDSMEFPFVKQGGTNLFRHRMQDYELIIVGDLPFETEKKIAESYDKL